MKRLVIFAAATVALTACDRPSTNADRPTPGTELEAVKAADAALQAAIVAKDLDKIMVHYADNVTLMPTAEPLISGKAAVTEEWEHVLAIPGFDSRSVTTGAKVSAANDLAYTMGSYRTAMVGEDGKQVVEPGKWLTIWKKQADGNWRIVVETYNTDVPPPDHQ